MSQAGLVMIVVYSFKLGPLEKESISCTHSGRNSVYLLVYLFFEWEDEWESCKGEERETSETEWWRGSTSCNLPPWMTLHLRANWGKTFFSFFFLSLSLSHSSPPPLLITRQWIDLISPLLLDDALLLWCTLPLLMESWNVIFVLGDVFYINFLLAKQEESEQREKAHFLLITRVNEIGSGVNKLNKRWWIFCPSSSAPALLFCPLLPPPAPSRLLGKECTWIFHLNCPRVHEVIQFVMRTLLNSFGLLFFLFLFFYLSLSLHWRF